MRRRLPLLAALAVLAVGRDLPAQTAGELVAQGIAAYNGLEYDAAGALLRRGLAVVGPDALPPGARPVTFVYLGATEIFRGRRDSAEVAFRQALRADPRHRPDPLVFPPVVANTFDAVRRTTAYVRVEVAPDTGIILGKEFYVARLDASALHNITVDVLREDGRPVRQLYGGPIADSLVVRWEGLDEDGAAAIEGRLILQIASRASGGVQRLLQLPLSTSGGARDTLPHPPPLADSLLLPEREPRGPALRALGTGLGGALGALILPSLITKDGASASSRYLVAVSLTTAGILGFVAQRPGRVVEDNIVANQIVRDAWRREQNTIAVENEARRRDRVLRIRSGAVIEVAGDRR